MPYARVIPGLVTTHSFADLMSAWNHYGSPGLGDAIRYQCDTLTPAERRKLPAALRRVLD